MMPINCCYFMRGRRFIGVLPPSRVLGALGQEDKSQVNPLPKARSAVILVATQVIEQSLDLDFDVGDLEQAPMTYYFSVPAAFIGTR
jgi:hypothetical protein